MTETIADVPNDLDSHTQLDNVLTSVITRVNKLSGFTKKPTQLAGQVIGTTDTISLLALRPEPSITLVDLDAKVVTVASKVDELIRAFNA